MRTREGYVIKRPKLQLDLDTWYKPLFNYDEFGIDLDTPFPISVGSIRQTTRGSIRPRKLQASPYEQELEVKSVAIRTLKKLPRVDGTDGNEYGLLMEESETDVLWDTTRPLIVHEQRVNFYDNRPPTTETILGRPLRNFAIPDGMYHSWDLHPDNFKTFDHGCVVQMLYKSLTKRPGGQARKTVSKIECQCIQ